MLELGKERIGLCRIFAGGPSHDTERENQDQEHNTEKARGSIQIPFCTQRTAEFYLTRDTSLIRRFDSVVK